MSAEKSLVLQRFHSCITKFLYETWICKTLEMNSCEKNKIEKNNREECIKSFLYSQVWVHARIIKGRQRVPSWMHSTNLSQNQNLDQIPVEYLPSSLHQQEPKLLQYRSEEHRVSWKNLKGTSFSPMLIKIYTRKYLMWYSHWKIKGKIFFVPLFREQVVSL